MHSESIRLPLKYANAIDEHFANPSRNIQLVVAATADAVSSPTPTPLKTALAERAPVIDEQRAWTESQN